MEYKPSELAAEIGCHVDTIYRSYIPAGAPHRRDARGQIWIVGKEFAEWARAVFSKKSHSLTDGQAWCLQCNQPVEMVGPLEVKPTNQYLELVSGRCSECGCVVNRARARSEAEEGTP
jgi:hypothetical protein